MSTKDFELAIEALGINGLEIVRFSYQVNGGVSAVYARMGELTWVKWDVIGRGSDSSSPRISRDASPRRT